MDYPAGTAEPALQVVDEPELPAAAFSMDIIFRGSDDNGAFSALQQGPEAAEAGIRVPVNRYWFDPVVERGVAPAADAGERPWTGSEWFAHGWQCIL